MKTFGDGSGIATIQAFHQDDELVAAVSSDQVARSDRLLEQPGDGDEGSVTCRMSEAVVDPLQPVKVDEDDGERVLSCSTIRIVVQAAS